MPTILQGPVSTSYDPSASVTRTFAGSCTPGSLIVVLLTQENYAGTFSVADPTNGSYGTAKSTGVAGAGEAGGGRSSIFSVANTASTALTVTATLGASSSGRMTIFEVSDAQFDAGSSGLGGQFTTFTGSISASASAAVFATGLHYPSGAAADSGYTGAYSAGGVSNAYHYGEYNANAGSAGTKTITFGGGIGTPNAWSLAIASFKAATSGAVGNLVGGSKLINSILLSGLVR